KIIVIGRQYGGTGRKTGRALAEALDLPYYDKEIINKVSAKYGYDPDILHRADEKKPSPFRSMLLGKYGVMDMYATSPLSKESLYEAQTNVIRQICNEGSCVIVGRTADYIMRDHPGLISVFIHAPKEWRASNLISRGEATDIQDAINKIRKADNDREGYYNYFTGRKWGTADNYHLTIDASLLEPDEMVALIARYIDKSKKGS
ncbi:MAG: cytidylate kinase-like family protein, partial [Muribaculaceae bacterium]|nr:cytidylate kinase-like family protein [Muribaculaceae bacterium]